MENTFIFIKGEEENVIETLSSPTPEFSVSVPSSTSQIIQTRPIFTRYLYYKNHVVLSLLKSLLEQEIKKAIFWAYELYFSGFQTELFSIILIIYNIFYESENSEKMTTFIESKIEEWKNNKFKHHLVATIIHTMAYCRRVTVDEIKDNIVKNKKITVFILYNSKDIEEYKTKKVTSSLRQYRILQEACLYATDKDVSISILLKQNNIRWLNQYFIEDEDLLNKYFYNWEYYSFFTPIWKERIVKCGGTANHETKQIEFLEGEGEGEGEERFYNEWGYEPDEQPMEITLRTVGYHPLLM